MNTPADKSKKTRTKQSVSASEPTGVAPVRADSASPRSMRASKPSGVSTKFDATALAAKPSTWVLRVGQHLVLLFSESSLGAPLSVPRAFVARGSNRVYLGAGPLNGAFGRSNGYGALLIASVPALVRSVHIDFGSTGGDASGSHGCDVTDVDIFFQSLAKPETAVYRSALAEMMSHLKTPQADLDALLARFPKTRVRAAGVSSSKTIDTAEAAAENADRIPLAGTGVADRSSKTLLAPAPCPASVKFHISSIKGDSLEGWIWNADAPEKRYEIQAWADGVLVAYGQATESAVGAQAAGLPVSDVGFKLSMPSFLQDGLPHTLEFMLAHKSANEAGFVLPDTKVYQSESVADFKPELLMLTEPLEDNELVSQLLARAVDPSSRYLFSRVAPKLSLHLRNLEFPQSKALLDFASKTGNPHPYFVFKTGELLLLRGQWKKAVEVFSAVLKQTPGSVHACVALAHALHRQGSHDKATEALKLALKLKPDYQRARLLLIKLECRKALEKADAKVNWNRLSDMLKGMWPRCVGDSEFEDLLVDVFDRQSGVVEPVKMPSDGGDEYKALRRSRRLLQLAMTLQPSKPLQSERTS